MISCNEVKFVEIYLINEKFNTINSRQVSIGTYNFNTKEFRYCDT